LGATGAYPEAGQACSGFLLEWDGFRAVLDLGYGTLPRLLAHVPAADVDAVVITHEHPDHCIDLHGLFRILHYGSSAHCVPLYCPPGVLGRLAGIEPDVDLHSAFDVHELPGSYQLGPFALTCAPLPHFVPNVGVRLEARDVAIAYTGDTGPHPRLADLGRGVDLFVVEATDRPGEANKPVRNLMTAEEAGQWAERAGADRLLLTHFWPGTDRRAAVTAAQSAFRGDVFAAEQGLVIELDNEPRLPREGLGRPSREA
jgi:ribonuclease BN (tRNA processing enzyme)